VNVREYREEVPNLLASTWLALQGQRKMVLGATKQWGCGNTSTQVLVDEERAVWEQLIPNAEMFYPSIKQWEVTGLQAGVRAMPPRTSLGALPLAGCINTLVQPKLDTDCWLIGGLGSRGLIYHAWLGELVAAAIVSRIEVILSSLTKITLVPLLQIQRRNEE
jgi:glycine/D-amino acid oxidase-like deaminating enzyme